MCGSRVTILVAGSAIFNKENRADAIQTIRAAGEGALQK